MTRFILGVLALACVTSAALAADPTSATLPWGDWIGSFLQPAAAIAVPIVSGFAIAGIAKVAPWASLFLSSARVQAAVQAGADYGINAIEGAVKGKTLTVSLGSKVIAAGVQHVVDTAPKAVVQKAGGAAGIAGMIFRALPLDENGSVEKVLAPALSDLATRGMLK